MPASATAVEMTMVAARAAAGKKAENIVALDVSERLALADVFLVVSGRNDRQVRAIVDAVEDALLAAGARRRLREGLTEAHWVLLDYDELVVHVQQAEDRDFYGLERLWKDCPAVALPADLDELAAAAPEQP